MDLLKCDKKWPICLLDFTYKNKVPEFFVFRVDSKNYHIIADYFYPEYGSLSPTRQYHSSVYVAQKTDGRNIDTLNEDLEFDD